MRVIAAAIVFHVAAAAATADVAAVSVSVAVANVAAVAGQVVGILAKAM